MAMNFGRKVINQISSWRSASATTGSAGGSQVARIRQRINRFLILPLISYNICLAGAYLYMLTDAGGWVRKHIKEPDEALRKRMLEKGVDREFCEAKITHIMQKIGSGSSLEHERVILRVYKRWMEQFPKDPSEDHVCL